jgi:hypothetical protein
VPTVPTGIEDGEKPRTGQIFKTTEPTPTQLFASVACKITVTPLPFEVVGVPEMTPPDDRERPTGNVPLERTQV